MEEAKLLGEDLEGETVERGGEDRVEEGEDLLEGEERLELELFLLLGMGLGDEACLSNGCFVDCFCPDGVDFGLVVFKFWPLC
jgi:hypothetical protein